MTKPLVVFADPEAHQAAYLKTAFAARPEAYCPAESAITTKFPSALLVNATHVQVELEVGNADDYPITERAQVRYTCYAPPSRRSGDTVGGRSDVKALASLTQALVYAQAGDAALAGTQILIGRSNVIVDPDTQNLMCWFLARLNMLATPL